MSNKILDAVVAWGISKYPHLKDSLTEAKTTGGWSKEVQDVYHQYVNELVKTGVIPATELHHFRIVPAENMPEAIESVLLQGDASSGSEEEDKEDGKEEDGDKNPTENEEEDPEGGEEDPQGGEEDPQGGEEDPQGGEEDPQGGEENTEPDESTRSVAPASSAKKTKTKKA